MPTLSKIASGISELTPNCLVPVDFNQNKILAASYELNFNDGFKAAQKEILIEIANNKTKIFKGAFIQCAFELIDFVSNRELDWRYLGADFDRKTNTLSFQGYVNKANCRERSVSNYLINQMRYILIKQSTHLKDVMQHKNALELKQVITSMLNHVRKNVLTDEVHSWSLKRQKAFMAGINSMSLNFSALFFDKKNDLYCDAITNHIKTLQCPCELSDYEASCINNTIKALNILKVDLLKEDIDQCTNNSTRLAMIESDWLHNFANSINKELENPYNTKSAASYYKTLTQWLDSFTYEQLSEMATQISINFKK